MNASLEDALQLPKQHDDEEIAPAIVALLTSAIHDSKPLKTLSEIYNLITKFSLTSYLDPLNTLPMLLPCGDPSARDVISLFGECASAKEVIMAVQEAAERLERGLEAEDEQDDDSEKDERSSGGEQRKHTSSAEQVVILIDLYASAIPRLKLRRKSASDTLKRLFDELGRLVDAASPRATQNEGRSTMSSIARLVTNSWKWSEIDSAEDKQACKEILKSLLDHTLLAYGMYAHASIAQRTLGKCFPRLIRPSSSPPDWQEGEQAICDLLDAYQFLDLPSDITEGHPSERDLIFSAYRPPTEINPAKSLSFLIPVLLSSVQTNIFLDESLAVLINSLHICQTQIPKIELSDDITLPLCGFLPSVASAHPDPAVRHQSFRVLSLLLASSDPQLRLHHLVEFTRDSEYPQMRVASVGLVKEALLQSLSKPDAKQDNLFCGSMFLRTFGPILFRPDPPDLFSSSLSMKDFQETSEPGRLVECLSLYYVLLQRDEQNLTSIRDKDVLKSIEHSLLSPIRSSVDRWMSDPSVVNSHLHDITPIVSLKISLERVDAARAGLHG